MGIRPSEVYFIEDQLAAFCFDRAVTMFGLEVDAALKKVVRGAKNDKEAEAKSAREFAKWVRDPSTPRFKDPAVRG